MTRYRIVLYLVGDKVLYKPDNNAGKLSQTKVTHVKPIMMIKTKFRWNCFDYIKVLLMSPNRSSNHLLNWLILLLMI